MEIVWIGIFQENTATNGLLIGFHCGVLFLSFSYSLVFMGIFSCLTLIFVIDRNTVNLNYNQRQEKHRLFKWKIIPVSFLFGIEIILCDYG